MSIKKPISDIKIGNPFRKDLGDIKTLANSIQEIELLHPIVINQNNELIAGQRRLEACKYLGWTEIPVTIVNLDDIVKGEFHENAMRKGFVMSERVAILEEVERQRIGHKPEKGVKLTPFQKEEKGKKSREIVAEFTGVSPIQLYKEKAVFRAAIENPDNIKFGEFLRKVDNKEMSVDRAYTLVRKIQELERIEQITDPQTDLEILEKLGISIRPYDVWHFMIPSELFAAGERQNQTAHLIFNLLYFFTEQNDLVVDPMAGGGVMGDIAKIMKRKYILFDIRPARDDIRKLDLTKESLPPDICKDAELVFLDPPYYLFDDNNDEKKNFFLRISNEFYELGTKKLAVLFPSCNENKSKKKYNHRLRFCHDYINAIVPSGKWRAINEIHCTTIQQPIPPAYYDKFYGNAKPKPFRIMSGSLVMFEIAKNRIVNEIK